MERKNDSLSLKDQKAFLDRRLRETEHVLQQLIDHLPYSVFWKDRDTVFLGCNRSFAVEAGVAGPAEIIGKTDYDFAWTADQADFFRLCDKEVMESGEASINIKEPKQRPDGTVATILTTKIPLYNEAGESTGLLGFYLDITEDSNSEQRNDKEKQELVDYVFHRYESMIGEFRDPLNLILNLSHAIKANIADLKTVEKDDEVRDTLVDIDEIASVLHTSGQRIDAAVTSIFGGMDTSPQV